MSRKVKLPMRLFDTPLFLKFEGRLSIICKTQVSFNAAIHSMLLPGTHRKKL